MCLVIQLEEGTNILDGYSYYSFSIQEPHCDTPFCYVRVPFLFSTSCMEEVCSLMPTTDVYLLFL